MRILLVLVVLAVVGLGTYLLWPRPKSQAQTPQEDVTLPTKVEQTSSQTVQIPGIQLEGNVALPPQPNLRLSVTLNDAPLTDISLENSRFQLDLPTKLSTLIPLEQIDLVYGDGHLQGDSTIVGGSVRFEAYQDLNGNKILDNESKILMQLVRQGADPGLESFFRYQLIVVSGKASLKEKQDSDTGAKDYYRYNLDLDRGWHIIRGELASNGYEITEIKDAKFDLQPFIPPGQRTPPTFTP